MNLIGKQCLFTQNVVKLINFAWERGYEVRLREVLRSQEQQDFNVKQGYTKTHSSRHLSGLAIDLELFHQGQLMESKEDYEPLGNYWHSMNKWNVWGGIWKKHPEIFHFEMR